MPVDKTKIKEITLEEQRALAASNEVEFEFDEKGYWRAPKETYTGNNATDDAYLFRLGDDYLRGGITYGNKTMPKDPNVKRKEEIERKKNKLGLTPDFGLPESPSGMKAFQEYEALADEYMELVKSEEEREELAQAQKIEVARNLLKDELGLEGRAAAGYARTVPQIFYGYHKRVTGQGGPKPDGTSYGVDFTVISSRINDKANRKNDKIVFKLYSTTTPELCSEFEVLVSDLTASSIWSKRVQAQRAPIRLIRTHGLAPDLKTVLSLFDKIDPNNLEAVLKFTEEVFNPYMQKLIDSCENADDKDNKLALLLANAQKEGLGIVGFALLHKMQQAQKTLTTHDQKNPRVLRLLQTSGGLKCLVQMSREYNRTDFVKQLLEVQCGALDEVAQPGTRRTYNPVVSLEELVQKATDMNEEELARFENFLEIWYRDFKEAIRRAETSQMLALRVDYRAEFSRYQKGDLPPAQHESDEFWLSEDRACLDHFLMDYRQASFVFGDKSANWINAQLQPIEAGIAKCYEQMAAIPRDERQYAEISKKVSILQRSIEQCTESLNKLEERIKALEVEKMAAFVAGNGEGQDRIIAQLSMLRKEQAVLKHYLQYSEGKKKMEASSLRLQGMLPQDAQYKKITEELKLQKQNVILLKIMVELDVIEAQIANIGQDQGRQLEKLRQEEEILKRELSYQRIYNERASKLQDRVPLQKALELMEEGVLSQEKARQHFNALMCKELQLSEAAVLGLCYTLRPFLSTHNSSFIEGSIISEPKMIVKREADSIIATLYTDATAPNGDKQSFCSQFRVEVKDLTYGNRGEFKKVPVREVKTYPVVADLKTLFSLWSKIDLESDDTMNQFKREILLPYLKKQIECRKEYEHKDKHADLLLANAENEGLGRINPALMQVMYQTLGYMDSFSTMSVWHGRKDQPKLVALYRVALTTPDEAAVSIEELIAKTEGMNKEELEEFELFLERFAIEFDKDVNMLRDQVSTLDEQKKSVGGLDGFQKQCRKHEAAVREQYKALFQLRCQFNVEGVAAAKQKQTEVEKAIFTARKDPVHQRYELLVSRQQALMQKRQSLDETLKSLDKVNNTNGMRGPKIFVAIAERIGNAIESVFGFRAKERKKRKDAISSDIQAIEEQLKPIENQIAAIAIEANKPLENPYVAYTETQLDEISESLEALCKIEAEIVANREKRKAPKVESEEEAKSADAVRLQIHEDAMDLNELPPLVFTTAQPGRKVVEDSENPAGIFAHQYEVAKRKAESEVLGQDKNPPRASWIAVGLGQ